ncbi:hypothetical protein [Comamonas koreensis]|uniref:Uncharacterized protein n=1 Tax=Comamonas koreensis TaxID=160825 RepID=A0AAW4XT67_9BURK|nr:hypothetical protein [Comamonas koreensis]MCD2164310.1 hypothetical protein [Comamonas koreensis]
MKDPNKLLVAAKVHEIATEKRNTARRIATQTMEGNGLKFKEAQWNHHNPISNFVPEALADLEAIGSLLWPSHPPETP